MEKFVPWSTRTDNNGPADFVSSVGSLIDLSALKEVVGPGGFAANAAGGEIDLHNLAKIESSTVYLSAGAVTTDLSSLTSVSADLVSLTILGGGSMKAANLSNLRTNEAFIYAAVPCRAVPSR